MRACFNLGARVQSMSGVRLKFSIIATNNLLVFADKVLYEEMMMNNDNVESNLLTCSFIVNT